MGTQTLLVIKKSSGPLARAAHADIETVHMIRKGQVRCLPKGAIAEQLQFVAALFAIPIASRGRRRIKRLL